MTININNGAVLAYIAADFTPNIATSSSIPSKIYYVASVGNSASSEVSWSCYTQGLDTYSIPQNCKTTGSGSGGCGGTTRWNGSSCVPCLTGATCSGGIITVCPTGFYGPDCATAVTSCTGYVNGTGEQATCVTPCPASADCSGGVITGCKPGYYGDGCGTQCSGIISDTWPNLTCQPCPANAVCNNGAISGCQTGYYGSNCTSQCQGTISGTWPSLVCTPCPASADCSGGVITGCKPGYYGSTCASQCQGTISGTWPSLLCTPCPANAVCNNGAISDCQTGYYGNTCASQCQGTISGTWPSLVCTTCSGSTPYWNGTSCQPCTGSTLYLDGTSCKTCPTGATCSGGSVTGCGNGFSFDNTTGTCTCSGYTSISGSLTICNACPTNTVCSNGAITGCSNAYSGTNCAQCVSYNLYGGPTCACICANSYSSAVTGCAYRRSQGMDGDWGLYATLTTNCSQLCTSLNHGPGGSGCYYGYVPYSCTGTPSYCSDGYSHYGGTPGVNWIH